MRELPRYKTFSQLIDQYEVAPVILLEIIADSCALDFQYLLKCYYNNIASSQMEDFAKVESYLYRVFSDEDPQDILLEQAPILHNKS